jgi:hypothetical protein
VSEPVVTAPATPSAAPEAPAPVAAEPGPAPGKSSPAERKARALAKFEAARNPPAAPVLAALAKTEPEAPAAADEPAEPAEAAPEPTADVPEQRDNESDAKFQARLVRAMADLQARDKTLREKDTLLKSEAAEKAQLKADFEAMRQKLEAITKDPLAALKAAGTSFDEVAKKVLAGELKAPTAEDELKAKLDERSKTLEDQLNEMKAKLEAKEKAEADRVAAEEQAATRAKDLDTVKGLLKASEDKFPVTASLSWGADRVLQICYEQQTNDVNEVAASLEKAARADLEVILQSPKALAALLKSQPKLRETIQAALGPSQSRKTPSSGEGPRVLASDMVSTPTTPIDRPMTAAEKKKRALAMLHGGQ